MTCTICVNKLFKKLPVAQPSLATTNQSGGRPVEVMFTASRRNALHVKRWPGEICVIYKCNCLSLWPQTDFDSKSASAAYLTVTEPLTTRLLHSIPSFYQPLQDKGIPALANKSARWLLNLNGYYVTITAMFLSASSRRGLNSVYQGTTTHRPHPSP